MRRSSEGRSRSASLAELDTTNCTSIYMRNRGFSDLHQYADSEALMGYNDRASISSNVSPLVEKRYVLIGVEGDSMTVLHER